MHNYCWNSTHQLVLRINSFQRYNVTHRGVTPLSLSLSLSLYIYIYIYIYIFPTRFSYHLLVHNYILTTCTTIYTYTIEHDVITHMTSHPIEVPISSSFIDVRYKKLTISRAVFRRRYRLPPPLHPRLRSHHVVTVSGRISDITTEWKYEPCTTRFTAIPCHVGVTMNPCPP